MTYISLKKLFFSQDMFFISFFLPLPLVPPPPHTPLSAIAGDDEVKSRSF